MGFILGGPLGALIGAALGHGLDRKTDEYQLHLAHGDDPGEQQRIQTAFFTALFSVMGHVTKNNNHKNQNKKKNTQHKKTQHKLNAMLQEAAIRLFNEG